MLTTFTWLFCCFNSDSLFLFPILAILCKLDSFHSQWHHSQTQVFVHLWNSKNLLEIEFHIYIYIKRWIVEKKCLFFTDWKVLLLFLMCVLDCLDAAGKWSWPQCHRQAGLHSTAQSICQGQLPAYPAASQTERFHQHPGHTGQHAAVSRNKYLSHVAHRKHNWFGKLWLERPRSARLQHKGISAYFLPS